MEQVGAHQFRNHFGWYMERTAAGEELLVTRCGKPCVRLVPVHAHSSRPPTSSRIRFRTQLLVAAAALRAKR